MVIVLIGIVSFIVLIKRSNIPVIQPNNNKNTVKIINPIQKKLALVLVDIQNGFTLSYDNNFAYEQTFSNVHGIKAFFSEASNGNFILTGNVYGIYSVKLPDGCDMTKFIEDVKNMALKKDQIDLNSYDYVMYITPANNKCVSRESVALSIPGKESILSTANFDISTIVHELGHSMGAYHARSLDCKDESGKQVPISQNCQIIEYGDGYDIMGGYNLRHFNVFFKQLFGWVSDSQIKTVTRSGVYTIEPLENPGSKIIAIKILKRKNYYNYLGNNVDQDYYVEYRQPFGFDDFDPKSPEVNGVLVRLAPDKVFPSTTELVKMGAPNELYNNSPLQPGQVFKDSEANIELKIVSLSKRNTEVYVKLGK